MPWHVEEGGSCGPAKPWAVIKDADGSTVACHDTKESALAQVAALYANNPEAKGMSETLERKTLTVEFKAGEDGAFRAVIATMNEADKEGDVALPESIQVGKAVVVSPFEHASVGVSPEVPILPPVGKAIIGVAGKEVVADGKFFLKTGAGRETYERVKAMGDLQQWSYAYVVLDKSTNPTELKAYGPKARRIFKALQIEEISPVVIGAGYNTRTEYIKSITASQGGDGVMTMEAEAKHALAAWAALEARVKSLADLRAKEGRTLSTANVARLNAILAQMTAASGDLEEFLTSLTPAQAALLDDATGNDPADSPVPGQPGKSASSLFDASEIWLNLQRQGSLIRIP